MRNAFRTIGHFACVCAFGCGFGGSAFAQSGLDRPQLGWMLDAMGAVRPVLGVAAATVLGDPVIVDAIAIGCNARFCLIKTDSSIIPLSSGTLGVAADAPPGPALFAFRGDTAWIYFSGSQQLMQWQSDLLTAADFTPDGEVLSLRASEDGIDFAMRRSDGVWIEQLSLAEGTVSITGALSRRIRGPVLLLPDGVLYATTRSVILRRPDGTEIPFDVAGVQAFYRTGDGYVQARTGDGMWAIRTVPGQQRSFLLPGVSP